MSDASFIDKLKSAGLLQGSEDLSGRTAAVVKADSIVQAATLLRDDADLKMDLLMDLGGADYQGFGEERPGRFCVSYQLFSTASNQRAWLKAYLPSDKPEIDSLVEVYPGANWYEREAWDMYGIVFKGHPYLKRVLLYEEFEGHPLRKDYEIGKMQPLIPMRDAVDYESVAVERSRRKD